MKLSLLLSAILLATSVTTPPVTTQPVTETTKAVKEVKEVKDESIVFTYVISEDKKKLKESKETISKLTKLSNLLSGSDEESIDAKVTGMNKENVTASVDDVSQYYLDLELLESIVLTNRELEVLTNKETSHTLYVKSEEEAEYLKTIFSGYKEDASKLRKHLEGVTSYIEYLQELDIKTMEKRYSFKDKDGKVFVIDYTMEKLPEPKYEEIQVLLETNKNTMLLLDKGLKSAENVTLDVTDERDTSFYIVWAVFLALLILVSYFFIRENGHKKNTNEEKSE